MNYFALFNAASAAEGLGTITLKTSGHPDIAVNLAALTAADYTGAQSSWFFHINWSGNFRLVGPDPNASERYTWVARRSLFFALQAAIQAAASAASWPSSSSLTFQRGGQSWYNYQFDYVATLTVVFSNLAAARLLGFSSLTPAAAVSVPGDQVPYYVVQPTLTAVSKQPLDYEPGNIASHVITERGEGFGLKRATTPVYREWVQEFEKPERTERKRATGFNLFTLQHLFEACRGQLPFAVETGFEFSYPEIFSFRSEGTIWRPLRASPGNGAQFHVPFKCVLEAAVIAGS